VDTSIMWAMVAMAAVNTAGYLIGLLIKGHYHIIETPTRMASTEIKTVCTELERTDTGRAVKQIMKNTEAISNLERRINEGGKHEASANE
jgi:hypothetical protein